MTDPWSVQKTDNNINGAISSATNGDIHESLEFEDSFAPDNSQQQEEDNLNNSNQSSSHQPLPDSQAYLKGLETKLEKLKKNSKLLDALSEKRDDCLRSLVQNDLSGSGYNNDLLLELEASIVNSDSAVHNLYRQLQPIQPVTVGETVHIVKFDQLEEQRLELEASESTVEEEELPSR